MKKRILVGAGFGALFAAAALAVWAGLGGKPK